MPESAEEQERRAASLRMTQVKIELHVTLSNDSWWSVKFRIPGHEQRYQGWGRTKRQAEDAALAILDEMLGKYGYCLTRAP